MSNKLVTPADVEKKLISLSRELDSAHEQLEQSEANYAFAKGTWDIDAAKMRLRVQAKANEAGRKVTVQAVEDEALVACEAQYMSFLTADAMVRVARANSGRIKVQIDITRSVGTAVRAAMDIS